MTEQLFELHKTLFEALNDIDEVVYQDEPKVYKLMNLLQLHRPLLPDDFYLLVYNLLFEILYDCVFTDQPDLRKFYIPLDGPCKNIHEKLSRAVSEEEYKTYPAFRYNTWYANYYAQLAQHYLAPIFQVDYPVKNTEC